MSRAIAAAIRCRFDCFLASSSSWPTTTDHRGALRIAQGGGCTAAGCGFPVFGPSAARIASITKILASKRRRASRLALFALFRLGDLRVLAGAISAISAISAGPFSDSKTATASFLAGPCYTPSGMPCLVHGRLCTSQDRAFCAVTLGLAFARLDEGDVGPLRARDRRMPTRLPRCHVNRLALLGELGIVNQSCPRAPACQLADAAFRSSWRSRARSRCSPTPGDAIAWGRACP